MLKRMIVAGTIFRLATVVLFHSWILFGRPKEDSKSISKSLGSLLQYEYLKNTSWRGIITSKHVWIRLIGSVKYYTLCT
jgi:hypothetical protein